MMTQFAYPPVNPDTVRVCSNYPDCNCNEYLPGPREEGEPPMHCKNGYWFDTTISFREMHS